MSSKPKPTRDVTIEPLESTKAACAAAIAMLKPLLIQLRDEVYPVVATANIAVEGDFKRKNAAFPKRKARQEVDLSHQILDKSGSTEMFDLIQMIDEQVADLVYAGDDLIVADREIEDRLAAGA